MSHRSDIDARKARASFERAAASYDGSAVLQREVAGRLMSRLDYIRLQPERVLDLGSGTGYCSESLLRRYPKSQVIALDFAPAMVSRSARCGRWLRRPLGICADAAALPLKSRSVDLVVSNLMLQWCSPLSSYFEEVRRVLRPGGLLMFTTFGPDTLKELRLAWAEVDTEEHVHVFMDMHDVGDDLLAAGFNDPVIDMEMITTAYQSVRSVLADIKSIGASYAGLSGRRGLMGKQYLQMLFDSYEKFRSSDGLLPATWEVVYGQAWVPEHKLPDFEGRPVFPIKLEKP